MPAQSLATRAAAALALMIGFYALALTISGTLLVVGWYALDDVPRIAIFCAVTALAILWAVLPRPDKFEVPGPRLMPEQQPELFEELRDIADQCGQEMPSEVYLVNDVNAWVSQRGGMMGFFSRRVMGLGLPLLHATTRSQFRAIIAHEFGHYHGGDTKLGPWIYKTRGAIGRTLHALSDSSLHKPFEWYGNFFMRITQSISRAQELAADRLSAQIAGARNAADALVAVHAAATAYDSYFHSEVVPLISNGYRAPLAAGFSRFLAEDGVRSHVSASIDHELREGQADVYDSHPPLRERVAALAELPQDQPPADEPQASSLLRDLPRLEEQLIRGMLVDPSMQLQDIAWEDTAMRVYLPLWRNTAQQYAACLQGISTGDLPSVGKAGHRFWSLLQCDGGSDQRTAMGVSILGCALSARLYDAGWMCDAAPGKAIAFARDGVTIEPFKSVSSLADGTLTEEAWVEQCRTAGIESLVLG